MNFVKRSLLFLMLLAAISLAGCAKSGDAANPGEMDTIKLAMMPYLSNTVFQIALDEGYFQEQGINIEVISFQSAKELIPMMLAGEIDAGAPPPSASLFNSFSKGGELKIIMALSEFKASDCPYVAYLARTEDVEAGIFADRADWVNASITVSDQGLNNVPGYILSEVLEGSGVTLDDMDLKAVAIPVYEEALLSGQVDIVYAIEPAITRLLANEDISLLEPAEPYVDGLVTSMITVGPKIYEDQDLANRFAIAYLKAVRQYLEGPTDRNVEHTANLTGLDPELVKQICWSYAPSDGLVEIESLNAYQQFLLERGLLDEFVAADVYCDPSFAEYAVEYLAKEDK
jgi:NitT/TauT family transport system substrate-binding protein